MNLLYVLSQCQHIDFIYIHIYVYINIYIYKTATGSCKAQGRAKGKAGEATASHPRPRASGPPKVAPARGGQGRCRLPRRHLTRLGAPGKRPPPARPPPALPPLREEAPQVKPLYHPPLPATQQFLGPRPPHRRPLPGCPVRARWEPRATAGRPAEGPLPTTGEAPEAATRPSRTRSAGGRARPQPSPGTHRPRC